MGCTSSSSAKEQPDQQGKNETQDHTISRTSSDRKSNNNNRKSSMYTTYAEPPKSQFGGMEQQRIDSVENMDSVTKGESSVPTLPETHSVNTPVDGSLVGEATDGNKPQTPVRTSSKGSIIRNGIYYSESELAEEGVVWQPKYWTPERIGKWVEEAEFPEGLKFSDVRKQIVQQGGSSSKKSSSHHRTRATSNSVG